MTWWKLNHEWRCISLWTTRDVCLLNANHGSKLFMKWKDAFWGDRKSRPFFDLKLHPPLPPTAFGDTLSPNFEGRKWICPGKLTCPWNSMVGRCIAYGHSPFFRGHVSFRGVYEDMDTVIYARWHSTVATSRSSSVPLWWRHVEAGVLKKEGLPAKAFFRKPKKDLVCFLFSDWENNWLNQ